MGSFRSLPLIVLIMTVAITFTGCNSSPPEPTNLGTARSELGRVLEVWKSGEFHRDATQKIWAKSSDEPIFFFDFDIDNQRLRSYEVISGEELKNGMYGFRVTVVIQAHFAIMLENYGKKTKEKLYYVSRNKAGKWLTMEADFRRRFDDLNKRLKTDE